MSKGRDKAAIEAAVEREAHLLGGVFQASGSSSSSGGRRRRRRTTTSRRRRNRNVRVIVSIRVVRGGRRVSS